MHGAPRNIWQQRCYSVRGAAGLPETQTHWSGKRTSPHDAVCIPSAQFCADVAVPESTTLRSSRGTIGRRSVIRRQLVPGCARHIDQSIMLIVGRSELVADISALVGP